MTCSSRPTRADTVRAGPEVGSTELPLPTEILPVDPNRRLPLQEPNSNRSRPIHSARATRGSWHTSSPRTARHWRRGSCASTCVRAFLSTWYRATGWRSRSCRSPATTRSTARLCRRPARNPRMPPRPPHPARKRNGWLPRCGDRHSTWKQSACTTTFLTSAATPSWPWLSSTRSSPGLVTAYAPSTWRFRRSVSWLHHWARHRDPHFRPRIPHLSGNGQ